MAASAFVRRFSSQLKTFSFSKYCAVPSATNIRFASSQAAEQKPEDEFHVNHLDGDRKGVVVFSLRRFRYKNALGRNIAKMFMDAMQSIKVDNSIRLVIIRSEVPGVFCAGADLKERLTMTQQEAATFVSFARGLITELHNLPMPTIAALDGAALGGGLEMALACDIRTAAHSSKIGLVETSLAIIPGAGGTQRLPRIIGASKAKELIFTSRVLDGRQAEDYGIVNHCVDQNDDGDAAYQRALLMADEIAPRGPIALKMAKAAINRGIEVELEAGLRFEEAYYAQVIPTKDRIEGLKAFKEKRPPKFEGH